MACRLHHRSKTSIDSVGNPAPDRAHSLNLYYTSKKRRAEAVLNLSNPIGFFEILLC
jgi:hypothetical protein